MFHTKFGPDRFSRLTFIGKKTTDKQTRKVYKFIIDVILFMYKQASPVQFKVIAPSYYDCPLKNFIFFSVVLKMWILLLGILQFGSTKAQDGLR